MLEINDVILSRIASYCIVSCYPQLMLRDRASPLMTSEELVNIQLRIEELEQNVGKLNTKLSYKEDIINDLSEYL